ncbi:MAG: hypothetical protein QW035_01620 [Candidatus Anstonellales archaeon]
MRHRIEGNKVKKLERLGAGIKEGEAIVLHPVEACYFAREIGISKEEALEEVKRLGLIDVLRVYEDLRAKGYVLMFLGDDIRVLRKGFRRGEDRSYAIIRVVKPQEETSWEEVSKFVAYAAGLRKSAVLAIVGDKIHYIGLGTIRFD